MAGTQRGGQKAAATNKTRYGKDFYTRIGRKGGKVAYNGSNMRGFALNRDLAREAGTKGGMASRRSRAKV